MKSLMQRNDARAVADDLQMLARQIFFDVAFDIFWGNHGSLLD